MVTFLGKEKASATKSALTSSLSGASPNIHNISSLISPAYSDCEHSKGSNGSCENESVSPKEGDLVKSINQKHVAKTKIVLKEENFEKCDQKEQPEINSNQSNSTDIVNENVSQSENSSEVSDEKLNICDDDVSSESVKNDRSDLISQSRKRKAEEQEEDLEVEICDDDNSGSDKIEIALSSPASPVVRSRPGSGDGGDGDSSSALSSPVE